VKDSRSATKPARTPIEKILDEMETVIVANRYGQGPANKADLIAKISDWRSALQDIS
jgi:hypothetical protein